MIFSRIYRGLLLISALIGSSVLPALVVAANPDQRAQPEPQVERVVAVDPGVTVAVCLVSGDIRVRGWDQNQVRVRSKDAGEIEFRRPAGVAGPAPAKEITVLIGNKATGPTGSCLADGNVELDVPRGASVQLRTRDGAIHVVDVATVSASTQSGDVNLDRVKRSVEASSIGGHVLLRNSTGSVKLRSVGGDIEALDVGPAVASDRFAATTVGGDIKLARAGYAELKASTVDGAVSLSGPLAAAGRYQLNTISGDVSLALPADSSFRLDARLPRNTELVSDFPSGAESSQTRRRNGSTNDADLPVRGSDYVLQHINRVYGTGDALITISSFSGAISLRKQ